MCMFYMYAHPYVYGPTDVTVVCTAHLGLRPEQNQIATEGRNSSVYFLSARTRGVAKFFDTGQPNN